MRREIYTTVLIIVLAFFANTKTAIAQTATDSEAVRTSLFDDSILNAKKSMMADPSAALGHAREAEAFARATPLSEQQTKSIATAYWLQAEALNRLNRPEDAAPLVQRALGLLGEENFNTKLGADLILARGRVARVLRDDQLALESFHQAHDIYATLGSSRYQAISLQSLGSIYQDARDYERVLEFYDRASEIHQNDPALDLASYNNRANAQRELGRFSESLSLSEQALSVAEGLESPILQARIISNMASTQVMAGEYSLAFETANVALRLMEGATEDEWRPVMIGVKAQALNGLGEYKAAAALFDQIFSDLGPQTETAPFRDIHQTAYLTYKAIGRTSDALVHLETFKSLDDSARDLAASASNVLMATEFDFASQELAISQLNEIHLEDEIALRQAVITQRTTMLSALIGFALLIAIGLSWGLVVAGKSRKRIEKANTHLEESNLTLEKANQMKTGFLANTSHEIRTPLNGILGMTQVMLNDDNFNSSQKEQIEAIWGAGDTLLAIVNDILDVSTIETGQFKIVNDVVNIPELTNQVTDSFRDMAEGKGIELKVNFSNFPEAAITDGTRIKQVLFNLISNAVKFTENGRVHVTLSVKSMKAGETLSILVSDTGIGIPETELECIFDTFHQVDSGCTRKFGGTGLGLSICRHIARALGGNIEVTSTLGQGARFEFTIPFERSISQSGLSTTAHTKTAITQLSDLDVLVVEDNLLNRTVIKALIEKHVKSVTLTEDGNQCMSALEQSHFDIILMDKQMPNMDGITATQTIRNMMNGQENTYILAVTADAYQGAREELLDAGVDDYLAKPVNVDDLLDALKLAIDRGTSHSAGQGTEAA